MPRSRAFAAACAALGMSALALTLWLSLRNAHAAGLTEGQALWRYFGYFTVLTNLLVVLALAARATGPRGTLSRSLCRIDVQTAAAVGIVMVFLVYHLLLRNLWQPQGWQWVSDQLLHTAMPVLFVVHWWINVPQPALGWRHVPACLIYPAAYAVYLLLRCAADGWYPYPFIDVATLGYPRVAVNTCGLVAAFVAVACLLIALGRWRARRVPA